MCEESEGFCKHIRVESEMFNGAAVIDGWYKANLQMGDTFTLTADPKFALKVLKLDL